MVTFAELALEDVQIPYTTNIIERLMGEVSIQTMQEQVDALVNRRAEEHSGISPREIHRQKILQPIQKCLYPQQTIQ